MPPAHGETMPLCFEVTINDEPPILAGLRDLKVLTAILSFVSEREELDLQVGGMLDRGDHVSWLERHVRRGDVVTIRIMDSEQTMEPATRKQTDPQLMPSRSGNTTSTCVASTNLISLNSSGFSTRTGTGLSYHADFHWIWVSERAA